MDDWLTGFIPTMEEDDLLIIMADHGNDPTIGHSNQTREYVPIMIVGEKVKKANIGLRNTMSDIGATFCDFYGLPMTAEGTSFLDEIIDRKILSTCARCNYDNTPLWINKQKEADRSAL